MQLFFAIIKFDYLQRTRSYPFLITLCAALAIAYTFVPAPNASYSTIRIAGYVGYNNAAWFGYVTAIMSSVFLSLVGFYLVNNSIKTAIKTKVGQVVAAAPISNFRYLASKMASNFLVLGTLLLTVLLMSIILFFVYNDGYPFDFIQFLKPYALIPLPALFFVSVLAVVFEVFLGKYSILQNIVYFFLFAALLVSTPKNELQFAFDVFGSKIVMHEMEETVQGILQTEENIDLSIGYVIGNAENNQKFHFNGIDFSTNFILSRLLWLLFGTGIVVIIAPFFHRFDTKEKLGLKKQLNNVKPQKQLKDIVLSKLPKTVSNYTIIPLIKTELLLLARKGKKWLWLLNGVGMVLLAVLPLQIAHQFVLPMLWFLQVGRLSDLTTKEIDNNAHYFTFTAYRPIRRALFSQLTAGILLVLFLASPLLIRMAFTANLATLSTLVLAGLFIVVFAGFAGIITKGKKLFELLFFMLTYASLNGLYFADYYGSLPHGSFYLQLLVGIVLLFGGGSFLIRKYHLKTM